MPPPLLAILALSEAFQDFWPKLVPSTGARLRLGTTIAELGGLGNTCGLVVAAGGAEDRALRAVEELQAQQPPEIVVVGVETDYRLAISLLRAGADNYFALPDDVGALRSWMVDRAERVLGATNARAAAADQRERYDFSRMIGRSPCLLAAMGRAAKLIPRGNATVLITGETGTGKELLARAVHYNGPRATKPFVEINCTALPENLLEAELFGYEQGAFTDARVAKPGLFESADGGTLFLDEVGDISLTLQGKLLRVLEDRRVRRLGSLRDQKVDIRIIAATHVDMRGAVSDGHFREDLYYRLSVAPVHLPPLRERGDDVIVLATHFLERFCQEYEVPRASLPPEIRRVLLTHTWPGNIRELKNAIERAVLFGEGSLNPDDLFPDRSVATSRAASPLIPFPARMQAIESAAARAMVEHFSGNKTQAAEALAISRKHLYALLSRGEE